MEEGIQKIPSAQQIEAMSLSEVDSYLDIIYQTTRLLHSRRNRLAPIAKLPEELLLAILLHLPRAIPSAMDRINVSQTCAHWRSICISAPVFWNEPAFCFPFGLSLEMMRRLGDAPFTASGDWRIDYTDIRAVEAALAKGGQLRGACLLGDDQVLALITEFCTSHTLPVLEYLSYSSDPPIPHHNREWLYTLLRAAPNARKLTLCDISIPYANPLLGQLYELDLLNNMIHGSRVKGWRPSLHDMTEIIREMPLLRRLTLDHALPLIDDFGAPRSAQYPALAHLLYLKITDDPAQLIHFVDHLPAPNLQARALHFWIDVPNDIAHDADAHRTSTVCAFLRRYLSNAPAFTRVTAFVPEIYIWAWTASQDECADPYLDIGIECTITNGCTQNQAEFTALLAMPFFERATALTLVPGAYTYEDFADTCQWSAFLARFPEIRSLQLGWRPEYHVEKQRVPIGGFIGRLFRESSAPIVRALCPDGVCRKLEALVFVDAFRAGKFDDQTKVDDMTAVDDLLKARQELGQPMKAIRITGLVHVGESDAMEKWKSEVTRIHDVDLVLDVLESDDVREDE